MKAPRLDRPAATGLRRRLAALAVPATALSLALALPAPAFAARSPRPTRAPANSRIDPQTGHRVYRTPSGRYEDRVVAAGNLCSIPRQRSSSGLDCIDLPGGARWQVQGSRLNPIRFGQTFTFTQRQSFDDSFRNTWTLRIDGVTPDVTADLLRISNGGSEIQPTAPQAGSQWIGLQANLALVSGTTQPRYFGLATGRLVDGNDREFPTSVIWRNAIPVGELDYTVAAVPGGSVNGRLALELPSATVARQLPIEQALRVGHRDEALFHVRWFPAPGEVRDTYFSINP